jgi:diguanylate cyclase (GGDEF)-like protein
MTQHLRILLVEDSEDDAALLVRELRKGGYTPDCRRVDNGPDLEAALAEGRWDLVITDHNLPGYSSVATLTAVKRSGQDVPVIIVSGSIGEEIAVDAMKSGAHDYIMKGNLARLVPAIERELRDTQVRHAHRMAQETIRHLAYHDPLTGLANRVEFESRLTRALRGLGHGERHALLYMDLDQFKIVNDTCGHEAGDELLRQLAVLLREPIREADTLARLGGDEFGMLLTHCSLEQAMQVAERVLRLVSEFRFIWQEKSFTLGASIGLVMIEDSSQSLSDVLRMADMACYAAKDKGRNRVHQYHAGDSELLQRQGEMQWVGRLSRALEENRFELFRQRIEPLNGHGRPHYEFLLRLLGDDGRHILPGAFIPAAERYGLMPALDRWVVRAALERLARNGAAEATYFINLSGATVGDEQFAAYVMEQLRLNGVAGTRVGFEITETAVIANLASAVRFIEQVKKLGCQVALDDFGAGLSSFSYLKAIPADYLKIDGGFIKDMLDDPMDHAIVESVNHIGHVAGLQTIAEFVETAPVRQRLAELGVDYAQGFGVHRPAPLGEAG